MYGHGELHDPDLLKWPGRRKFKSKTSKIVDTRKRRGGSGQRRKIFLYKIEDTGVRKGRHLGKHYVFPLFYGSESSRSRLAKAASRCGAKQMWKLKPANNFMLNIDALKKCMLLWREAHFEVKKC